MKLRFSILLIIITASLNFVFGQDTTKTKKDSVAVYGTDVQIEQVVVSSSRINSYINASPLRVEILGEEDLLEKAIENPGNISEMLTELSAVQLVQTSLLSGNTNFRLLGLKGEQTILLKDGFPMYGGLSQDLSFMHIAPFNIKQVEIIKGASSVFWGNGALAGAINLITREPAKKSELKLFLNRSTLGSLKKNLPGSSDAAVFASGRNESVGYTFSGTINFKSAVDVNGDQFTEVPDMKKMEFEPKFYFYLDPTSTLTLDLDYMQDKRAGGNINNFYEDDLYFLRVNSFRRSGFVSFNKSFENGNTLTLKTSYSYMNKDYGRWFSGGQTSTYSEASYSFNGKNNNTVIGLNFSSDLFREHDSWSRNYNYNIAGLFIEDQYRFSEEFTGEAGLRFDNHNVYGAILLPQFFVIYKPSNVFFARLSAGTAYRSPSLFASDNEDIVVNSTMVPNRDLKSEKSFSTVLDLNYTTFLFGSVYARLNQIFYYTEVQNPFELRHTISGVLFSYVNEGAFHNYGTETNLNLSIEETSLFAGFSYNHSPLSLTPDFKLVYMLAFDEEESGIRVDVGGMTIGKQKLSNGITVDGYSTAELLLSKAFSKFTFVLNFENIFDYKQSQRAPLVTPVYFDYIPGYKFSEIYSPVTGREINVAVLFSL